MQLQHGVAVSSSRIPWEKEVSIVRDSLIHSLKKVQALISEAMMQAIAMNYKVFCFFIPMDHKTTKGAKFKKENYPLKYF